MLPFSRCIRISRIELLKCTHVTTIIIIFYDLYYYSLSKQTAHQHVGAFLSNDCSWLYRRKRNWKKIFSWWFIGVKEECILTDVQIILPPVFNWKLPQIVGLLMVSEWGEMQKCVTIRFCGVIFLLEIGDCFETF